LGCTFTHAFTVTDRLVGCRYRTFAHSYVLLQLHTRLLRTRYYAVTPVTFVTHTPVTPHTRTVAVYVPGYTFTHVDFHTRLPFALHTRTLVCVTLRWFTVTFWFTLHYHTCTVTVPRLLPVYVYVAPHVHHTRLLPRFGYTFGLLHTLHLRLRLPGYVTHIHLRYYGYVAVAHCRCARTFTTRLGCDFGLGCYVTRLLRYTTRSLHRLPHRLPRLHTVTPRLPTLFWLHARTFTVYGYALHVLLHLPRYPGLYTPLPHTARLRGRLHGWLRLRTV